VIRIDPVRMAHGILTGIGFLCGGVIFREGFNVRGLTTAASLWTTATLGMLFGTFAVLAAVSVTERYAPQRRIAHIRATYRRGSAMTLGGFGELLAAKGLKSITIDQALDGDQHSFTAIGGGYTEGCAEALARDWSADAHVTGFEIRPQQA